MTGGNESSDGTAARETDGTREPESDVQETDPQRTAGTFGRTRGDPAADGDEPTAAWSDTVGDVPILLALFSATITLLGAVRPLRAGAVDPLTVLIAGLAGIILGAVFAGRHGHLSRAILSTLIATASVAVGLLSIYGLSHDYATPFGVPPIADSPALLVALFGAGLSVAAAAAIHADLSGRQIARRATAAAGYWLLGAVGYVSIIAWANLLAIALVLTVDVLVSDLPAASQSVFTQVATVLGTASIALAYLALTDRDRSYIDLRVPTIRDLGYVVGGVVVLGGLALVIGLLLTSTGTESTGHSSFERAQGAPELLLVLAVASIVVIGPFEELLYRNVIQKGLTQYFSTPGAIVVASVVFASAHLVAYGGGPIGGLLVSLGTVFVLSIALGTLYAQTDNLLVPALVHGLYNAYTYYSQYLAMVN